MTRSISPVRPDPSVQRWFTAAEAAIYARMSRQVLLRFARDGRLKGEQVSGRNGTWRFHRDDLDAFLRGDRISRRSA
jgi:excisionase family DNA binding protein